ncbi:MAG: hypothetical protein JEZ06_00580 [Anaerolineaceae bacterium]|nr:hypothetical protein [Anaerolineaceae bacterium]
MKSKKFKLIIAGLVLFVIFAACSVTDLVSSGVDSEEVDTEAPKQADPTQTFPAPTLVPVENLDVGAGPVLITGIFEYTNDFYPEGYAYEQAVSLIDMTGFVLRDEEWKLPTGSQVLGFVQMDLDNNSGAYRLLLPARPNGEMNDVDQDDLDEKGLQIFAIEYTPNWTGGPFYAGDDYYVGWPNYLASVTADTENKDEINGGKLIIWAADQDQEFPTGFGEDGLLFTEDDPVAPVEAGYSVVDLDQKPFAVSRNAEEELTLYEPTDVAVTDLSDLTFSEAFDQMFETARKEYAFNGIEGKEPDWDTLYTRLSPMVEEAQRTYDTDAFYMALREFVLAFEDGHVGLDGGDAMINYNSMNITGGYGFAIRELDDGRSLVVFVLEGSGADRAGIEVGAELLAFNGKPIIEAIGAVEPFSPQSTAFGLRFEQTIFLLRGQVGEEAEITFQNPKGAEKTVTLTSEWEMDSLFATYLGGEVDTNVLPVEYQILDNMIGYIQINSNSDDLNLAYRIFERALKTFEENAIEYLLIDMRLDFGGAPLGLAGYLTDETIVMGQLEYYSENTGAFEAEGEPQKFEPLENQYEFTSMLLLVDQFCFSACEIEAYGFSQVPGMIVAGQFPTGGVEAETARGDFDLPAGMSLTVPTGRFLLPDGTVFLEGVGVEPEEDILVDEESVLAGYDVVLERAIGILLGE